MSKKDGKRKTFFRMPKEPLWIRIIKYVMLVLFGYGVIFWSGTAFMSLFTGSFDEFSQPAWVGASMAVGVIVIVLSMVLALLGKYIAAFLLGAGGSAAVLAAAAWFVRTAKHELETRAVSNDLLGLDKHYMYRALPVLAAAVMLLFLAAVQTAGLIRRNKRLKEEKESAPVKSIID